jgi:hypothetical protein
MFSSLRRLIGLIKVTEVGDVIRIDGLPADVISRDIGRIWNTNNINSFMFNHISDSSISFNKFFAPDFVYALNVIIKNTKCHVRALNRVIKHVLEHTWMKSTVKDHQPILNFSRLHDLKATMKDHQMRFLNIYNNQVPKFQLRGFLLGAAPGSGKTLTCMALNACLETDVMIIVCPKNATEKVWGETIRDWLVKKTPYWRSDSSIPIAKGFKYYIIHFDALDDPEVVRFFRVNKFRKPMIALDESHNLNEITSERTKAFIDICDAQSCQHVVWSSGTLVKALGKEVMPMLRTVDPFFSKDTQDRFEKIFGKKSSRALSILHNRLGFVTFQVDKKEIMGDIPEPIIHNKLVQVPGGDRYTLKAVREVMREFIDSQVKHYQEYMKDYVRRYEYILDIFEQTMKIKGHLWFSHLKEGEEEHYKEFKRYKQTAKKIRESYDPVLMKDDAKFCNLYEKKVIIPHLPTKTLRDEFKNVRSIYKYYPLKVQGEALGRVLGKLRTECNVDIIKNAKLEEQIDVVAKKTIIFSDFVEVVDEGYKTLKDIGYEPLRVYGDTNNDLVNIVAKFRDNPDANPLLATYKSLSSAVPLVMANQVIFANSPYRDYMYQQAISRAYRLGQDSQVYGWYLLLDTGEEPNISTRSNDIMNWSRQQVEAILGGKVEGSIKAGALEAMESLEDYPSFGFESIADFIDFVEGVEDKDFIEERPSWSQWH